jgi:hypothetical protein
MSVSENYCPGCGKNLGFLYEKGEHCPQCNEIRALKERITALIAERNALFAQNAAPKEQIEGIKSTDSYVAHLWRAISEYQLLIQDYKPQRLAELEIENAALAKERAGLKAALEIGQQNCDDVYDDLKQERDRLKQRCESIGNIRDNQSRQIGDWMLYRDRTEKQLAAAKLAVGALDKIEASCGKRQQFGT